MQSDCRGEYPGSRKEVDEFEIGFLNADKVYRMERDKVERFSASGLTTFGISLKNPE